MAKIRQTTTGRPRPDHRRPTTPAAPSTSRRCARIDGIEVLAGETQRRLRGQRQPRPAGRRPARTTSSCSTPTCSRCATGWPACSTRRATDGDIGIVGGQAAVPGQPDPVRRHDPQPASARVVRPSLSRSSPPTGGRPTSPARHSPPPVPACTSGATSSTRVGLFDEDYGMGYEDVDYCLRAWQAGYEVVYAPSARLHHHESVTRGTEVGERERKSQRVFWKRWATFFDARQVLHRGRQAAGRLRHRGHDRRRWPSRRVRASQRPDRPRPRRAAVDTGRPTGLVRSALPGPELRLDYDELAAALAPLEAIKVATWWKTADRGVASQRPERACPVYFVQDIETSYYRDDPQRRYEVLELLPPRVPVPDDLRVEPRASARARTRGRADLARAST